MRHSEYLTWTKRRAGVRYNLSRSGAPVLELSELSPTLDYLLVTDKHGDGWTPLLERIAARYGVTPAHVATTNACSMANHLVYGVLLNAGDEVLLESPVYEPLVALTRYLGATPVFFRRRVENGWRVDPDDVRRALTQRTRLVVLSNLHNPTGAFDDDESLAAVAAAAREVGAHVLVDEVYLDLLYAQGVGTAARLADNVVTTRSLTKSLGLDALRIGWLIAEPALVERARRLTELFANATSHPGERLAALALDHADAILERVNRGLTRNLETVDAFVRTHPRLSWVRPRAGTVGLVHVEGVDVDDLVERLHGRHEVALVPGRFFGVEDAFRISWSLSAADLATALDRVDLALRES